ncbi:hypothetical protein SAMN04488109_4305 [Chryseolinea serpens]|uniref:Uncharacterized protein n=1 Tax=Chryseolinea serpens TaxID=947013 RepID=A0A1M5TW19_9BACT|nr:hypothetical protein SAMN04488109_4305 [Chryseolinea serpens]
MELAYLYASLNGFGISKWRSFFVMGHVALTQLADYSREYRSEGYGIYLVLWLGQLDHTKNPKPDLQGRIPT